MIVFEGIHTTVLSPSEFVYIVKYGVGKTIRKTFRGEFAWADAQRFCWDQGDLGANL